MPNQPKSIWITRDGEWSASDLSDYSDAMGPYDLRAEVAAKSGPIPVNDEVRDYIAGVTGVVEANGFEAMCLLQQWRADGKSWISSNCGYGFCIGFVAGRPVHISLSTARVEDQKILILDATSEVVDWGLIETWLEQNLPKTAFDGERINKSNAQNFHIILTSREISHA